MVLGRRESCDIKLPFPNVSSQHCELVWQYGLWWIRDLNSEDPSVRSIAVTNIAAFRENAARAVPAVLGRLHDGDSGVRAKAAILFRYLPKGAVRETDVSRVVKALAERLSRGAEPEAIVRYEAAPALTRFGTGARAVLRDLSTGIRDTSTYELREACIVVDG